MALESKLDEVTFKYQKQLTALESLTTTDVGSISEVAFTPYCAGDRVEIIFGAFFGMQGRILKIRENDLDIAISVFDKLTPVTIPNNFVRRLTP